MGRNVPVEFAYGRWSRFLLWDVLALGSWWFWFHGFEFLTLTGSVGVRTSSYIAAQAIFWIGGMIMFGLGAMIDAPDYSAVKHAQDKYGDVRVSP